MAKSPDTISLEEFMAGEKVETPKADIRYGQDVSDVTVPLGDYSLEQTKNITALQRKRGKKKTPTLSERFDEEIAGQGGWGLSPETKQALGANGPIETLRPVTDIPSTVADAGYRGLQALEAGTKVGLDKVDDLSRDSGLADLLSVGGNKFLPGSAVGALMEAFPLGGLEAGVLPVGRFTTPKGDTMAPEIRAKFNEQATDLFGKGASKDEMNAWAKENGMASFGPELDDAIRFRDEAQNFKGTTSPKPEDVFPTDESRAIAAEEWGKNLGAPKTVETAPKETTPVDTPEPTISKKEAAALFNEELSTPKTQTTKEWEKSLKEEVKKFSDGKEAQTENIAEPQPATIPETAATPEPTVAPEDVVSRLTTALTNASKATPEQQALYSQARRERLAAAREAMKTGGREGYIRALGTLKGELPKTDFNLGQEFSPEDVQSLFTQVQQSPNLRGYEPLQAMTGLEKLLNGKLPSASEISTLGRVFPKDFVQAVTKNKSLTSKILHTSANALNLPRALMSSFDLSAPLRQGVFLIGRGEFWKNWSTMFKSLGSEKAFTGVMDEIRNRPTYSLMEDSKLGITDVGYDLSKREEDFISQWAEKVPGVKASERAYTGYLNKLRADVFDSLVQDSRNLGIDFDANPQALQDISNFVNSATGRGDLGKLNQAAPILNGLFFSPRLVASRLDLLVPVRYVNPKVNPAVRKAYIKSLLSFGATALAVTELAKAGGADVEADPRSSDFGKIKTGNTRYDILGGFGQYITLGARLLSNETKTIKGNTKTLGEGYKTDTRKDVVERFVENKFAPVPGYIRDALQGSDPVGQPFDAQKDAMELFIPLFWQDVQEMQQEYGTLEGALRAAPGVFGVGVGNFSPAPTQEEFMQGEPVDTGTTAEENAPEEISLEEFMKGEVVE